MPKSKIPRPEALTEIHGALWALVRYECHDSCTSDLADRISEVVASRQDAIDRLQSLATKVNPEGDEAKLIKPVLAFEDADRARLANMPLGDYFGQWWEARPDAKEKRQFEIRAREGLVRLEERARAATRHSDRARAEKIPTGFNHAVEEALATLPLGPGASEDTWQSFKVKYPKHWEVAKYKKATWKKERIAAARKIANARKNSAAGQGSHALKSKPRR